MTLIQSNSEKFLVKKRNRLHNDFVMKCNSTCNTENFAKSTCCNCKNSLCLKLYCECFSTMLYCDPNVCSCQSCMNNSDNQNIRDLTVQSYIRKSVKKKLEASDPKDGVKKNNLGCTMKQTCSCKKSFCSKKYCECYQRKFKCNSQCKCIDCKNIYNKENKLNIFSVSRSPSIPSTQEKSVPTANSLHESQGLFPQFEQYKLKTVTIGPNNIIIDNYNINKCYVEIHNAQDEYQTNTKKVIII